MRALVMAPVMVVAVVFMIPVTLVVCPAVGVVVVVGVGPIGARIGWPAPHSGDPHVTSPGPVPIPVHPNVARTGKRGANLIAQRRWSGAYVYADLRERWSGNCRS
jgi:hypothetical protein